MRRAGWGERSKYAKTYLTNFPRRPPRTRSSNRNRSMPSPSKTALFGATGAVGKALAAELAKQGRSFRVVGRSKERLQRDFRTYEALVEYCAADLASPTDAARAAAGVDTI